MNIKIYTGFLICILLRSIFVLLAYFLHPKYVYYMSFPAAFVSIGFFVTYMKYKPGDLGVFQGNVWWNDLRLIHSIIYGIFAFLAFSYNKKSYIVLFIDVIIGILAFLQNYKILGNK